MINETMTTETATETRLEFLALQSARGFGGAAYPQGYAIIESLEAKGLVTVTNRYEDCLAYDLTRSGKQALSERADPNSVIASYLPIGVIGSDKSSASI